MNCLVYHDVQIMLVHKFIVTQMSQNGVYIKNHCHSSSFLCDHQATSTLFLSEFPFKLIFVHVISAEKSTIGRLPRCAKTQRRRHAVFCLEFLKYFIEVAHACKSIARFQYTLQCARSMTRTVKVP